MLVWDQSVLSVINQTGGSGGPSGAFLLNRNNDLTPLFITSIDDDGYLAPVAVGLSPGGSKVVFVWLDAAQLDGSIPFSRVSILDLETTELPADPRLLPEIWSTRGDVPLSFADPVLEWAANDRISIQSISFGPPGGSTYVLQLEGQG